MASTGNITELNELASSQWGIFTSAQALSHGVSRTQLSRMSASGRIESISYGTYQFTSGDETPHARVKAAWMSLFPKATAYERLKEKPYDAVVVGRTAACMHGDTDFYESPYHFAVRCGKRTTRKDVCLHSWDIDARDVKIMDGLPVATVERTIADLVRANEDMSLVRNFIVGMCGRGHIIDKERLDFLLRPLAKRRGFGKDDGAAFANELMRGKPETLQVGRAVDLVAQALNGSPLYDALSSATSVLQSAQAPSSGLADSVSKAFDWFPESPMAQVLDRLQEIYAPIQQVYNQRGETPIN